jgi:hypothetical protein
MVGIGTLVANSYFLRRAGVREELEEINVTRRARQGLITGQTARMFALMLFIQIGGDVANDGFDVAQLPSHLLMATMFALIGSWIEYGNARAELRKLESGAPDPAYTSGERIGRGIARIFRR